MLPPLGLSVFFSQVAGGWCDKPLAHSPQGTITPRAALD